MANLKYGYVPFYNSLMNVELFKGQKTTHSHVLIFGLITQYHSYGDHGCFASNEHIAELFNMSVSNVARVISQLKAGGWIDTINDKKNDNRSIIPMKVVELGENEALTRKQQLLSPVATADARGSNSLTVPENKVNNKSNNKSNKKEIGKPISKNGGVVAEGYTPKDAELSKLLRELASKKFQYLKIREPTRNHLRTMNRIHEDDGYDYSTIEAVIRWATQDDFWAGVIQSEQGLRRNFNKLLINAERWHKENQRTRTVKL